MPQLLLSEGSSELTCDEMEVKYRVLYPILYHWLLLHLSRCRSWYPITAVKQSTQDWMDRRKLTSWTRNLTSSVNWCQQLILIQNPSASFRCILNAFMFMVVLYPSERYCTIREHCFFSGLGFVPGPAWLGCLLWGEYSWLSMTSELHWAESKASESFSCSC